MLTLTRVFGIITLLGVLLGLAAYHGVTRIGIFVNVLSLAFVVLGIIGILLLTCESSDWRHAAIVFTRGRRKHAEESLRSAAGWFRCASRGAISSGVIVFLFMLIKMLATLGDPNSIGVGMVTGLLPLLYGTVLSEFLFHPLATALDRDVKPLDDNARWTTACVAVLAAVWLSFLASTFSVQIVPAKPQAPFGSPSAVPFDSGTVPRM